MLHCLVCVDSHVPCDSHFSIFDNWQRLMVIAELQRAKRASEAPWVRKIGDPSSQENLVMTSAYDRASERTSVQTRGEGEGRLELFLTFTHMGTLTLAVFCLKKSEKHSFLFAMSRNDRTG